MKVKIPISLKWNKATEQWRVLWLDGSHLQEFSENDEHKEVFECKTVKALIKRLGLSKEEKHRLMLTLERV